MSLEVDKIYIGTKEELLEHFSYVLPELPLVPEVGQCYVAHYGDTDLSIAKQLDEAVTRSGEHGYGYGLIFFMRVTKIVNSIAIELEFVKAYVHVRDISTEEMKEQVETTLNEQKS